MATPASGTRVPRTPRTASGTRSSRPSTRSTTASTRRTPSGTWTTSGRSARSTPSGTWRRCSSRARPTWPSCPPRCSGLLPHRVRQPRAQRPDGRPPPRAHHPPRRRRPAGPRRPRAGRAADHRARHARLQVVHRRVAGRVARLERQRPLGLPAVREGPGAGDPQPLLPQGPGGGAAVAEQVRRARHRRAGLAVPGDELHHRPLRRPAGRRLLLAGHPLPQRVRRPGRGPGA